MGKPVLLLQECGTLNRVFAAFFMNECYVKDGVDFEDSKPQMDNLKFMNSVCHYFHADSQPVGLKKFFHGKVVIPSIDMDKFRSVGIYDFFDDEMKQKVSDVAKEFADTAHQQRHCDFIFSALPDVSPMIYDCIQDPESNFRSRLVIGADFGNGGYTGIWEFYCLMMTKFREVELHPIYGKSYKDVDLMTNEELDKYNKPSSEQQHD